MINKGTYYPADMPKDIKLILDHSRDLCYCFDRESRNAGHDINPPCASIVNARDLALKLKEFYAQRKIRTLTQLNALKRDAVVRFECSTAQYAYGDVWQMIIKDTSNSPYQPVNFWANTESGTEDITHVQTLIERYVDDPAFSGWITVLYEGND